MPDLAEKWELSADGKTYTFRLRKGVKWHKGYGELTADDVKFSYDRVLDPQTASRYKGEFKLVEAIEVVDPPTVRIRLKSKYPGLPQQGRGLQPGLRGEPQGHGEARGQVRHRAHRHRTVRLRELVAEEPGRPGREQGVLPGRAQAGPDRLPGHPGGDHRRDRAAARGDRRLLRPAERGGHRPALQGAGHHRPPAHREPHHQHDPQRDLRAARQAARPPGDRPRAEPEGDARGVLQRPEGPAQLGADLELPGVGQGADRVAVRPGEGQGPPARGGLSGRLQDHGDVLHPAALRQDRGPPGRRPPEGRHRRQRPDPGAGRLPRGPRRRHAARGAHRGDGPGRSRTSRSGTCCTPRASLPASTPPATRASTSSWRPRRSSWTAASGSPSTGRSR